MMIETPGPINKLDVKETSLREPHCFVKHAALPPSQSIGILGVWYSCIFLYFFEVEHLQRFSPSRKFQPQDFLFYQFNKMFFVSYEIYTPES